MRTGELGHGRTGLLMRGLDAPEISVRKDGRRLCYQATAVQAKNTPRLSHTQFAYRFLTTAAQQPVMLRRQRTARIRIARQSIPTQRQQSLRSFYSPIMQRANYYPSFRSSTPRSHITSIVRIRNARVYTRVKRKDKRHSTSYPSISANDPPSP